LGIDTYQEPVIFMASSCPICQSEGWAAQSRVQVFLNGRSIVATLNVTTDGLLLPDEASLSDVAWHLLGAGNGDLVRLAHSPPVESLSHLRAKVYGETLSAAQIESIIRDIVAGRYSEIDLAAFVTAFAGSRAELAETTALTRAMIDSPRSARRAARVAPRRGCADGFTGTRPRPCR
jgi:thymidine phosphorylase